MSNRLAKNNNGLMFEIQGGGRRGGGGGNKPATYSILNKKNVFTSIEIWSDFGQ